MQLGVTYSYTAHGTSLVLLSIAIIVATIVEAVALWRIFRKAGRNLSSRLRQVITESSVHPRLLVAY
jgi:hypothetical protein